LKNFLDSAIFSARMAGSVIKEQFYCQKVVTKKGPVNLLTETDGNCERMIVEYLSSHFPEHKFFTEEGTASDPPGGYRWIIDPLDGTTNFVHSIPFVAVSIALELDGEIILGVVYNPILDELFTAEKGKGAYLNLDKRLSVTNVTHMHDCLVATGFPYNRFHIAKRLGKIVEMLSANSKDLRRTGSASCDLCYVAAGRFDAYFEEDLKPWDIAAGMLMVQEAGGIVSDYYGNPVDFLKCDIFASGSGIRDTLLNLLQNAIEMAD